MTATLLGTFLRCPARAGFERDPVLGKLKRTGLRAALGIAAHSVKEQAGTGRPFEELWDEECGKVFNHMLREWAPARPPAPSNWPGAALTKARIARGWAGPETGAAPVSPSSAIGHGRVPIQQPQPGPLPWREKWLQVPSLGIAGKPDLVERCDASLRVLDFKTGIKQGEATEDQRRQLLLYCSLVWHTLGEMPQVAGIKDAAGTIHPIDFTRADVIEIENLAVKVLTEFKAAVGHPDELPARPSQETCVTCPFRIICDAFLETHTPEWDCGPTRVGKVTATSLAKGHSIVDMAIVAPSWAPRKMRLIGFPFAPNAAVGEVWGFSDFTGAGGTARGRWNTLVYRWRNAEAPENPS